MATELQCIGMVVAREMKGQAAYSPFFHSRGQEVFRNAERKDLNRRPTKFVHNGMIGAEV